MMNKETIEQINEVTANTNGEKTVVILATGGTIAGVGESGRSTGYRPGSINIEQLLSSVPKIAEYGRIRSVQICNINSDDMTSSLWIDIAKAINKMAENEDICGFVITHGTDTLEETAYFLNLTVTTAKPVILTGSLRPATSISADGPMNLYQSVVLAFSDYAVGKGVMVVFSDQIYSARSVIKSSTYSVTAMSGGDSGSIGIIRDDQIFFYETPDKRHTVSTEFNIETIEELPKVNICYFAVDSDPDLLKVIASRSDGIVIAGAGAGEFSKQFKAVIEMIDIPVVISSRVDGGIIMQKSLLCPNTISANNLNPQKAAVLLRLALTVTNNREEIVRIFQEY